MQNKNTHQSATFEQTFTQFIEESKPTLLSYVLRLLPVAEAEEVLQETHIKFYYIALGQASLGNVEQSLSQFRPLLFSIARNLSLSRLRHQKVVLKHQQNTANSQAKADLSIENTLIDIDQKERLRAAIMHLPPICKQVFIERKIHNKSHAEIAEAFQISPKTVENHIARGLKLCREYMISSRANVKPPRTKDKHYFSGGE